MRELNKESEIKAGLLKITFTNGNHEIKSRR
jgi:hypothetical protein